MHSNGIKIQPFCPNLGAIVTGIDLSQSVSATDFNIIKKAFLDFQVHFYQDQKEKFMNTKAI